VSERGAVVIQRAILIATSPKSCSASLPIPLSFSFLIRVSMIGVFAPEQTLLDRFWVWTNG
jgi:hypothetical protein